MKLQQTRYIKWTQMKKSGLEKGSEREREREGEENKKEPRYLTLNAKPSSSAKGQISSSSSLP